MTQQSHTGMHPSGGTLLRLVAGGLLTAVALALAVGLSIIFRQGAELRALEVKVAVLEEAQKTLAPGAMERHLAGLKQELELTFRERLALLESRPASDGRALEESLPGHPAAPAAPYTFELIQLTQFDVQNGQEVILTRRSNLEAFFGKGRAMDVAASHLFQVWQDNYLLLIYRDLQEGRPVQPLDAAAPLTQGTASPAHKEQDKAEGTGAKTPPHPAGGAREPKLGQEVGN